eukprot:Gb_14806 [translate_table: standard]
MIKGLIMASLRLSLKCILMYISSSIHKLRNLKLNMAIVLAVLMNIYIMAINQVIDVDIDKINKPYLLIAFDEFSQANGVAVTLASIFLCIDFGFNKDNKVSPMSYESAKKKFGCSPEFLASLFPLDQMVERINPSKMLETAITLDNCCMSCRKRRSGEVLQTIKGIWLIDNKSLLSLESRCLSAMSKSLRVLALGDWISLDDQIDTRFDDLNFLQVGDLDIFSFKDISKFSKLRVFHYESKYGAGDLPEASYLHL